MVRSYIFVAICVVFAFALGSEACKTHDQPCEGGGLGDCCDGQNLVCYKACPDWKHGRCYHQGKTMPGCPDAGVDGTSPATSPPRADSLPQCVNHDGACTGEHGTVGNCCSVDNLYCHKNNPAWKEGRCYYGNGRAHQTPTLSTSSPGPKRHQERKASKMCKEYTMHPWLNDKRRMPTKEVSKTQCPVVLRPLIADAQAAFLREYPHMALIGGYSPNDESNLIFWCGGSLISLDFVMTAAHCKTKKKPPTHVRLGGLESNNDVSELYTQTLEVAASFTPSNYQPPKVYDDLMLLKLKQSVKVDAYVRPACLYTGGTVKKDFEATGWGATWERDVGRLNNNLMKVRIYKQTSTDCAKEFPPDTLNIKLPEGIQKSIQLCAKPGEKTQDMCQGDSGGPLSYYMNSTKDPFMCMHIVYGVTSMNPGTCGNNNPAVFTRISHYLSWIENIVWS